MWKLKTCLIAKPPFTKPPFVNSRSYGLGCDIHTHAHAQDSLFITNLYNNIVQLEVRKTFSGRGMGMNITAQGQQHDD